MRLSLAALLLTRTLVIQAQDAQVPAPVRAAQLPADTPASTGTLTLHQSDNIAKLMMDYSARQLTLKGYRVQIYLGDRDKAEELRRSFLMKHPDIPAYLSYLAPNFRVRVGDQRDRLTAEKMREDLRAEFPGLYVVPDEIELPRLDTPDE
jgi:hypothetical protein